MDHSPLCSSVFNPSIKGALTLPKSQFGHPASSLSSFSTQVSPLCIYKTYTTGRYSQNRTIQNHNTYFFAMGLAMRVHSVSQSLCQSVWRGSSPTSVMRFIHFISFFVLYSFDEFVLSFFSSCFSFFLFTSPLVSLCWGWVGSPWRPPTARFQGRQAQVV